MIYGISAGAGLAAGVTVLAREKGDVRIDGQLLSQPMLDYRTTSETRARVGPVTWTFAHNRDAWQMILRDVDTSAVSALASPALLDDFTDLPSAFIDIGTEDIFLDEAMSYAMRLSSAGISTELHIWGGGYHGFDALDPTADISRLSRATRGQWLERVFA